MKKKVSRQQLVMRLLWESRDLDYDKEDRKRYKKLYRFVNHLPKKTCEKVIANGFEFYKGLCFEANKPLFISKVEFDTLLAVVSNIKEDYYKKEVKNGI